PPPAAAHDAPGHGALRVVSPGILALIQDAGRRGLSDAGVSLSGALDRQALAAANELVGNARGAAVIEAISVGVDLEAVADAVVAVVGEGTAVTRVHAGESVPQNVGSPFALTIGDRLRMDSVGGLRCWIAVRGGIAAPRSLGSRSADTLSGLGPAPLRAGDVIPVGDEIAGAVLLALPASPRASSAGAVTLRVILGPRDDWFTADAVGRLLGAEWQVDARSNRVGIRLSAAGGGTAPIERAITRELASEGVVAGSIQVPSDGDPILFLADHPVTGGYPVIAVVVAEDLGLAAQCAPGARVRFTRVAPGARGTS
ncbi:MAG: biotin-dependent carboxyltransferase family protein, partial [Microbacterium sp.]